MGSCDPHPAVLVGDVSIAVMAASGLGPRGLQPRVRLPTEAKRRNGYVLTDTQPVCSPRGNGICSMDTHPMALGKVKFICRLWFKGFLIVKKC